VKGDGGHASMPVVDPAVQRLARAVVRIGNRPMPQRIIPSIRKMLSVLAQDQGAMQRFAMKNLWLSKSVMLSRFEKDRLMNAYTRSTRAVTILSAGVKDNSVPKLASATVNMRLLPGDSDATALRYLRDTVNDSRVDITLDAYSPPPPESAVDTPFYTLLAEAAEDHYPGVLVAPALLVASTDSKHFSDISDVVYRFSPVLMTSDAAQTIHGSNERVGVAAMHGLVKVNISILERAAVAF
jgi:carboxypeptidase PM20D1